MNKTVDALINTDKSPKIRNVLNFTLDGGAYRILLFNDIPWVGASPVSCPEKYVFAAHPC